MAPRNCCARATDAIAQSTTSARHEAAEAARNRDRMRVLSESEFPRGTWTSAGGRALVGSPGARRISRRVVHVVAETQSEPGGTVILRTRRAASLALRGRETAA